MLSLQYPFPLLCVIVRVAVDATIQMGVFKIYSDTRFPNITSSIAVLSDMGCCRECLRLSDCVLVNHQVSTSHCELVTNSSAGSIATNPGDLVTGWTVYVYHSTPVTANSAETTTTTTAYSTTYPLTTASIASTSASTTLSLTTVSSASTEATSTYSSASTTTTSPSTCAWSPFNGTNYCISTFTATWDSALQICQGNPGGTLANLDSEGKQLFIEDLIKNMGLTGIILWIGGRDSGLEVYNWQTSTILVALSSGYTNWADGQPDNWNNVEDCVVVDFAHSYKWNDKGCLSTYQFVCESQNF